VTGQARDVVLSDAMMGYLQFVAGIPVNGNRWLYSDKPYKLATPALSVINQWQLALDNGNCRALLPALHRRIRSMPRCISRCLRWWLIPVRGRSYGRGLAASGAVEQRCSGFARNSSRSGILNGGPKIALPGDDPQGVVVSPSARRKRKTVGLAINRRLTIASWWRRLSSSRPHRDWGRRCDWSINARLAERLSCTAGRGAGAEYPAFAPAAGHVIYRHYGEYSGVLLVYYQNGSEVLASRVIVGRPDRKTPMMSSALNNVVVNPPWNVPPTLARKDILPKVWNDPGYLERHGYTVMRGWNSKEAIDPYMVDWSTITASNLPFRFQQAPGAHNSLGATNSTCRVQKRFICTIRRTTTCSRKIRAR
jgi:hypothetical protein